MVLRSAFLVACLASAPVLAQDKPLAPLDDIVACVTAGACKNMQASTLNWFDVVRIPVQTFSDGDYWYSLGVSRGALSVWIALPGEKAPSRLLTLDAQGRLLSAELGPQPGDSAGRQDLGTWFLRHRSFMAPERTRGEVVGEEFRSFWMEQAAAALAAIRRHIAGQETAVEAGIVRALLRDIAVPWRDGLKGSPPISVITESLRQCPPPPALVRGCVLPDVFDLARTEAARGAWPFDLVRASVDTQNRPLIDTSKPAIN